MKTGQMLFVAFGGMLLGAGGTLAVQTGLVNYEVTLDIRPRAPVTLPPPILSSTGADPYVGPPVVQSWEPAPLVENRPVALPPLNDQQIAEIVSVREHIGPLVTEVPDDLSGPQAEPASESFAQHLRAAAGIGTSSGPPATAAKYPLDHYPVEPAAGGALARGLREAQLR